MPTEDPQIIKLICFCEKVPALTRLIAIFDSILWPCGVWYYAVVLVVVVVVPALLLVVCNSGGGGSCMPSW